MSQLPSTEQKQNYKINNGSKLDNRNSKSPTGGQAKAFITWYNQIIDNDRQNLALYLSDDATLEWFGRTIKTRKKISSFLKHDMQCSRHDFVTFKSIDKVESRQDRVQRKEENSLTTLLHSPEVIKSNTERLGKRRILRSNCNSPEWAEGCQPVDEIKTLEVKRLKINDVEKLDVEINNELCQRNGVKRGFDDETDINSKGDGGLGRRVKRKLVPVTSPNPEIGQGDCLPSTSGTDSDKSHDALNAQLPKVAVECNGYIEFTRTRNSRSTDAIKWERKCKVQISYSEDPLNVGEYIIWAIYYTDESKCRRNLLPAFEQAAKDEKRNKIDD